MTVHVHVCARVCMRLFSHAHACSLCAPMCSPFHAPVFTRTHLFTPCAHVLTHSCTCFHTHTYLFTVCPCAQVCMCLFSHTHTCLLCVPTCSRVHAPVFTCTHLFILRPCAHACMSIFTRTHLFTVYAHVLMCSCTCFHTHTAVHLCTHAWACFCTHPPVHVCTCVTVAGITASCGTGYVDAGWGLRRASWGPCRSGHSARGPCFGTGCPGGRSQLQPPQARDQRYPSEPVSQLQTLLAWWSRLQAAVYGGTSGPELRTQRPPFKPNQVLRAGCPPRRCGSWSRWLGTCRHPSCPAGVACGRSTSR